MENKNIDSINFFTEICEHQIKEKEFFSNVLLESLCKHFNLDNMLISYFDIHGEFLSWINKDKLEMNSIHHPYRNFVKNDIIRNKIYKEAIYDKLTYFNTTPKLYKSTNIINNEDYDSSQYVKFIKKYFNAHYSLSMAFGINAYIQVVFFKSFENGDFKESEIKTLNKIYSFIANSYKNFKTHEQTKIISNIQNEIISSGEKAYLITDDFMHILNYNNLSKIYLKDILGSIISEEFNSYTIYSWLHFLLNRENNKMYSNYNNSQIIKNYIFKSHTYHQCYSNGIIDKYHWITISKKDDNMISNNVGTNLQLTNCEQKIAELMYSGLTYKAIASELIVSYHTVKNHVQNIYNKCGVKSRFELYKIIKNSH